MRGGVRELEHGLPCFADVGGSHPLHLWCVPLVGVCCECCSILAVARKSSAHPLHPGVRDVERKWRRDRAILVDLRRSSTSCAVKVSDFFSTTKGRNFLFPAASASGSALRAVPPAVEATPTDRCALLNSRRPLGVSGPSVTTEQRRVRDLNCIGAGSDADECVDSSGVRRAKPISRPPSEDIRLRPAVRGEDMLAAEDVKARVSDVRADEMRGRKLESMEAVVRR